MKFDLGVALNKAKGQRIHIRKTGADGEPGKGAADWQAPVYTQTRKVALDMDKIRENRCISALDDAPESDFYKVLRTHIQLAASKKGWRTFMITSAQPGEGKTLTAVNLAFSFARAYNQTVLLVDADLKRQQVHRYLGIESEFGLLDYLLDERSMSECLLWPEVQKLVLMSGARTIRDSSELLGSPMMHRFVEEVRDRYADRYVFFDTPPILLGADTMALAPFVDGIVVIVKANTTSRDMVKKAIDLLPKEKILGVVLNAHDVDVRTYYYYHKYYQQQK
jgi:non-specific protein-tyrosine kinase